jgi:hypothetical protein
MNENTKRCQLHLCPQSSQLSLSLEGGPYADMPGVPAARGQPLEPRPWLAGQDGAHTIAVHKAQS